MTCFAVFRDVSFGDDTAAIEATDHYCGGEEGVSFQEGSSVFSDVNYDSVGYNSYSS